jgi:hypothetical protein
VLLNLLVRSGSGKHRTSRNPAASGVQVTCRNEVISLPEKSTTTRTWRRSQRVCETRGRIVSYDRGLEGACSNM